MIQGFNFADWLKKTVMDKDEICFGDLFEMRLNAFAKIIFHFAVNFIFPLHGFVLR